MRLGGRFLAPMLLAGLLTGACAGDDEQVATTTTAAAPTSTTVATTASTTSEQPTTPPAQTRPLPNVVGMDLQLAQDTLQAAGFYALKSHDAKGLNRNQVLDRNWTVVDQTPPAGAVVPTSQVIDLGAVKDEEYQGR